MTIFLDGANNISIMPAKGQINSQQSLESFFDQHVVFTVDEIDRFLVRYRTGNRNTRKALLTYYKNRGRIVSIRRGLYGVVQRGADPERFPVDPYLIAAKLTSDAVLSYHTALEFHGKAYSVFKTLTFTSGIKSTPFTYQSHSYVRIPPPGEYGNASSSGIGIINSSRSGLAVRVTSFERTLLDVLDRPDLSGSWEEIWRSLESIEFFDLDRVLEFVTLLGNATTAAKVGFFLDQHREILMINDEFLRELRRLIPSQPHYISRSYRKKCRLIRDWNLMVPDEIINRVWGEVL